MQSSCQITPYFWVYEMNVDPRLINYPFGFEYRGHTFYSTAYQRSPLLVRTLLNVIILGVSKLNPWSQAFSNKFAVGLPLKVENKAMQHLEKVNFYGSWKT